MNKERSEFVGELQDRAGETRELRILVHDSEQTGSIRIAARRASFTDAMKFLPSEASKAELRGRVDLLLVDFGIYFHVSCSSGNRIKAVVVTGGFAEEESFTMPSGECARLAAWIRNLPIPESGNP